MNHSTTKPTKAQQERLDAIHAMPCIACDIEDCTQGSRTEAHHLVDKGTRKLSGGHDATIPLCGWHHRGEKPDHMKLREMHLLYGPSLELQKKEFKNIYGNERTLLAMVDAKLAKRNAA